MVEHTVVDNKAAVVGRMGVVDQLNKKVEHIRFVVVDMEVVGNRQVVEKLVGRLVVQCMLR